MTIVREDIENIDFSDVAESDEYLPLITPGELLREEFMGPLGLSANALARALRVPPNRITAILHDQRAITADTALRLARYFRTSPQFWLNLQKNHELALAERALGARILEEVQPRAA